MSAYGHTIQQCVRGGAPCVAPAGATTAVSDDVPVSTALAVDFVCYATVTGVTAADTLKLKLQEWTGEQYVDVGDVAEVDLTVDGEYCIALSTGVELEALVLPLTNKVRLAVEAGPGSSCTVTSVRVWIKP